VALVLLLLPGAVSVGLRSRGTLEEVAHHAHGHELDISTKAVSIAGRNNTGDGLGDTPATTTQAPMTTTVTTKNSSVLGSIKNNILEGEKAAVEQVLNDDRAFLVVSLLVTFGPTFVCWALTLLQLVPFRSPYKPGQKEVEWSLLSRVFQAHLCERFADNAELALRGAVFGLLASLPYIVADLQWLYKDGRYSSFAVLMFVFTLYKSVGETISFAWYGMVGTFWAAFNIFMMHGFFPGGVAASEDNKIIGIVDFAAFTILMLSLNVGGGTRVFALSWHVYFMMEFLNPSASGWSTGWEIKRSGPAVSALVQSGIGCGLAVLATLVPYPIFALDKARMTAIKLTNELSVSYEKCVDCYCADSRKPIIEDGLRHSLNILRNTVQDLRGHVGNAWWECLGRGRPQRIRLTLELLDHSFHEIFIRLCSTLYALDDEEFSDAHSALLMPVKPLIKELTAESSTLFCEIVNCCNDGHIDDAEADEMEQQKAKVIACIEALTVASTKLLSKGIDVELADENTFLMSCCAYGREAVVMANAVKELRNPTFEKENISPLSCFNIPADDLVYRNAVVRNAVSIFFAFALGYAGRGAIIKNYNSNIASICTLLMTSSFGSAMTNNLGRLQGVVLGSVFGQLAYAFLAYCAWYGYLGVGLYQFFWLLITLFAYYNVRDGPLCTIACLLAAFGATGSLMGCSSEVYSPSGMGKIIDTVCGVTIMTISDQIFSVKTASRYGFDALVSAWTSYKKAMRAFFDPKVKDIRAHSGAVMGQICLAESVISLADTEPRFARVPFKRQLFEDITLCMHNLRESLCSMEVVCSSTGTDNAPKASFLVAIEDLKELEAVKKDFVDYQKAVDQVLNVFIHDTEDCFFTKYGIKAAEGKCPLDLAKDNLVTLVDGLDKFLKTQPEFIEGQFAYKTLEANTVCKISSLMFHMHWQLKVLYKMKHQMLSL
jgi:hypothetical protein